MVSKLFVLEFLIEKAAQEVTVSHSGLFVVFRVSLQNNLNLEYVKIQTSTLTSKGVFTPFVPMHANLVTPSGDIEEFLKLVNYI
jgi:hypothetical protein